MFQICKSFLLPLCTVSSGNRSQVWIITATARGSSLSPSQTNSPAVCLWWEIDPTLISPSAAGLGEAASLTRCCTLNTTSLIFVHGMHSFPLNSLIHALLHALLQRQILKSNRDRSGVYFKGGDKTPCHRQNWSRAQRPSVRQIKVIYALNQGCQT